MALSDERSGMLLNVPQRVTQDYQPHVNSDRLKKHPGVYGLCPSEDPRRASNRTALTQMVEVD